ncbi:exodeoxyribonuclease VII small subunit [Corynebacterium mendelii]|uniref:Exodeoxyribonuclease 7 small subunit n=1 Tax=Corynebacterium mendelii TaxID=2765362 RepID=A0A939E342_9CORY|nr:exodeoxyribonuclease VII small subunit [Corynebacterium mendelii]MBN9644806.1 exodeoxyribonuclease VII small subunit [Corynebacterium mendelii]
MNPDVIGSGEPKDNAFTPTEKLSYEQARDELVETVGILERGSMGLDEALKYWERGEALAARCEQHLANARHKVEQVLGNGDNDPATGDHRQ